MLLVGVPQGSVLELILFLIYDVISICCRDTTIKLVADDLKLYSVYIATDNSSDLISSSVDWSKSTLVNVMFFLYLC